MEAKKLKTKKKISKGNIKKSMKNIICRPDPLIWPEVSEEDANKIHIALEALKIELPHFSKPLWKDLKNISKEQRPKPPKIPKMKEFVFGMSMCQESIDNCNILALILESEINPRIISQPVIEKCINNKIPVICLKGLRKCTKTNFGICTSCLGITKGNLQDLVLTIENLASNFISSIEENKIPEIIKLVDDQNYVKENKTIFCNKESEDLNEDVYLYRTSKATRVFVPHINQPSSIKTLAFGVDDFIKFSSDIISTTKMDTKLNFKKMKIKRILNNVDRKKHEKTHK